METCWKGRKPIMIQYLQYGARPDDKFRRVHGEHPMTRLARFYRRPETTYDLCLPSESGRAYTTKDFKDAGDSLRCRKCYSVAQSRAERDAAFFQRDSSGKKVPKQVVVDVTTHDGRTQTVSLPPAAATAAKVQEALGLRVPLWLGDTPLTPHARLVLLAGPDRKVALRAGDPVVDEGPNYRGVPMIALVRPPRYGVYHCRAEGERPTLTTSFLQRGPRAALHTQRPNTRRLEDRRALIHAPTVSSRAAPPSRASQSAMEPSWVQRL